jgi:hypothetical protein
MDCGGSEVAAMVLVLVVVLLNLYNHYDGCLGYVGWRR